MARKGPLQVRLEGNIPHQNPNAFSLKYKKDTTPKAQSGTKIPITKEDIYAKYPAFRNMGDVTIKADTAFTKAKTGVGDIEYFGPGADRDSVRYNNGFSYPHPGPGTHGVVYNPDTNDEQSVMLDMLHGMRSDPTYDKIRGEFGETFRKRHDGDINTAWEEYNRENPENDGREQFQENYIDGIVRNLLFEGSRRDYKDNNYWRKARKVYLKKDPEMFEKFEPLESYIKGEAQKRKCGGKLGLMGMGQMQHAAPTKRKGLLKNKKKK